MSETLQAVDVPEPHPIRMVVTDDLVRSRLTVFFRLLLAIPHFIWVTLWSFAVALAALAAWVIGLVTGRVPVGLHSFIAAYTRYYTHLDAYLWIAADPYPGFTGEPGYPVDVEIAPATPQSRLTIFFRLLLAIPAAIVMSVLQNVAWIVAILAWFYALVTGRMSKGMRDLQVYCLRYQAQTLGYLMLLTQRYPSFSDE
ncbi:MAG TPA: DUF4389 domain-containing protein [Gaiella sp.]|uniref:DUF4389 domain-containing protein n=1 Tax=Gaiella sp. TaxID=2663207 RepID=UPI002D7E6754|nr:DUF4389 domain-containing protein [Gaiella sp.]HET9285934.1 DUF4389 domain-containing protein [Gaiella sp.]